MDLTLSKYILGAPMTNLVFLTHSSPQTFDTFEFLDFWANPLYVKIVRAPEPVMILT